MNTLLSAPPVRASTRTEFLVRHPDYADWFEQLGLRACADFLALSEEIVSGHPDRQVSRVTLCAGDTTLNAYLKREHRVPWKERLGNWWAGFGWVSKSRRELYTLQQLADSDVGQPHWLAAGEDSQGRAFVLLRALDDYCDLPTILQRNEVCVATLAAQLGRALARLHEAGFDHPDLYAGHVFVNSTTLEIAFIDWQRSRRHAYLSRGQRWRALAALHATLHGDLASATLRLRCLESYLHGTGEAVADVAAEIAALAQTLRQRRHIRTKCVLPAPAVPSLFLLDQNRQWVTPEGRQLWAEGVPPALWHLQPGQHNFDLPDGSSGRLTVSCQRPRWWQPSPWTSPERHQMALLFRLARLGIAAPRVLAVGEYPQPDGTVCAFLLTRLPTESQPLSTPCAQAVTFLQQLQSAGFEVAAGTGALAWQASSTRPVLVDVAGLRLRSRGLFTRLWSPLRVASS